MIRSVIVEDENLAAARLKKMIESLDREIEVVVVLDSVREAVKFLSLNKPDLIFMDIHLGDGLAFDIFEKTNIESPVIFTTAYNQYAIKAFKVNSIDYLLKPVNEEELCAALDKLNVQLERLPAAALKELLKALKEKPFYKERFMVYSGRKIVSVSPEQITCVYSMEKSQFLITREGRTFTIDYSLDQLEEMLDSSTFFRVNRQLLINFNSIKEVEPLSRSRLKIITKIDIPVETLVSVHRTASFRRWLEQ